MNFLADINVSRRIVEALCASGFHAVRVSDVMDCRSTDVQILEEARKRNAVVISHDQDFTAILATTGASSPSLINIRVSFVEVDRLTKTLLSVIGQVGPELSQGVIVTIDDRGARIHRLPVG